MHEKIYEAARELANMILETEEGKAYNDAKYIFDGDEAAKALLQDYSTFRNAVQTRIQNGEITQEELDEQNVKLKAKIEELTNNEVINNLFIAERNFNNVFTAAMNIVTATVQGDESGGCSGSCSTCGGCH